MKKTFCILFMLILLLAFSGCSENNDDNSLPDTTTKNEINTTSVNTDTEPKVPLNITCASSFSDGVAWVECNPNNEGVCIALIDTDGNILKKFKAGIGLNDVNDFENGAGYIKTIADYNDEKEVYHIINKKGEIIASSENGDFDKILGGGGGYFLVYKFVGNIDSAADMFGVIDSTGNWVNKLREWPADFCEISPEDIRSFSYLNNGMFTTEGRWNNDYLVYNVVLDKFIKICDTYGSGTGFNNNIAFYRGYEYPYDREAETIIYIDENDLTNYITVGNNAFSLTTDNDVEILDEIPDYNFEGFFLTCDGFPGEKILHITDVSTGTTVVYTDRYVIDVTANNKESFVFSTYGKDEKYYFTLMDKEGNISFDFIAAGDPDVECSNNRIIYESVDKVSYSIADTSGNIIAENLIYDYIYEFNSDLARARITDDSYVYLDLNGNVAIK